MCFSQSVRNTKSANLSERPNTWQTLLQSTISVSLFLQLEPEPEPEPEPVFKDGLYKHILAFLVRLFALQFEQM